MNNYALQSYFKKLSAVFYEIKVQINRLEKEIQGNSYSILKLIESNNQPEDQKYFGGKLSKKDLEERESMNEGEVQREKEVWETYLEHQYESLCELIEEVNRNDYKFILTTEEEVYTLLFYFNRKGVSNIINLDDAVRDSFPESEMAKAFYKAYVLADEDALKNVIEKYL